MPAVFAVQSLILLDSVTLTGYPQSEYSQAVSFGLYPAAPLLAGVAAFQFQRFRRFHSSAPQVRYGVALRAYAPLVFGTPLAVVAAMLLRVREIPDEPRTLVILTLAIAVLIACGLWGLAMAWALPTVLAVPLAVGFPFWWIAVMPSLSGAIYRQLTPDIPCCRIDAQLSTTFLVGLGSLSIVLVVGLAAVLFSRRWSVFPRLASVALVAVVPVAAFALSIELVRAHGTPVSQEITEPREAAALSCSRNGSLELCLWPEQVRMRRELPAQVQRLNRLLSTWRLPTIRGVNQAEPTAEEIALRTPNAEFHSRDEMILFLSAGYVAARANCDDGLHGDPAADERIGAIALALGWVPDSTSIPPDALTHARAALQRGTAGFSDWFLRDTDHIACARAR